MTTPKTPTVTIKVEVPFATFKDAQEASAKMVEAIKAIADARSKPATIRFVKVEL